MDLRDMHAWMAHLGTMVSCTNKAFWCFAWWSVSVAQRLSFLDHLQLPITITNYPRSVRRKLPNPSSEMDDDLDGIIRQAKALATLGSKIIHVFPPWNSIEIIPHATTHTVHYVIKDDSCGAHDMNASTKYHSVKAILLNKWVDRYLVVSLMMQHYMINVWVMQSDVLNKAPNP